MIHAIGIDVGTTNVKVSLVSSRGGLVASAAQSLRTRRNVAGDVAEQDADALWRAVKDGMAEAAAAAPAEAADVVAIGCCSQYSSIVPVGPDAGPVADMVLWQDKRGTNYCLDMVQREGALGAWLQRGGVPPVAEGLSLAHILHFQYDRPEVHARAAAYLEPMDYVNARLTGRIAANQCTMFMSQLCDNRTLGVTAYDDELLKFSGVDASKLPPLDRIGVPVGTLRSELAVELGLPQHVVVMGGMNDSHADVIATGALTPGRAGLAVGTTSVLVDVVDHPAADLDHEVLSMPSPFGTYLVWAETGIGGRALEFALNSFVYGKDALGDHRTANPFSGLDEAVAASPAGSNGTLFLPWLTGSLAPQMSPSVRGAFLNLKLETRRIDLIRAVTEGVGHSVRWLLPFVEAFTGTDIVEVGFVGGAAHSAAWSQVLADALDRPVLQMRDPDLAVARAVALVALERYGELDQVELGQRAVTAWRFEPTAAHRMVYNTMHQQFVASFKALRPVFEGLNP